MSWYKQFDLVWVPVVDFEQAKSFFRPNLIDLHDNPIKLRNMSLNCKSFLNIKQNKINVLLDE